MCEYLENGELEPNYYAIVFDTPAAAARAVQLFDASRYKETRTLSVRTGGRTLSLSVRYPDL
jgi:hypothetical protein